MLGCISFFTLFDFVITARILSGDNLDALAMELGE